jgi:hypothetical protein
MTKQTSTLPKGLKFDHISFTFNAVCVDENAAEPMPFGIDEGISLPLNDEVELNRILEEKPYLMDIIPALVKRVTDGYDPNRTAAKKLKEALGQKQ